MYNKLFSKILRSSIWLQSDKCRIVWITLLAAMDKDGFAQFSTVQNLADAARVPKVDVARAVTILESPEPETMDEDEFQGRRIERVPGGWLILKAKEYNSIASHELMLAQGRERVRRHRAKKEEKLPKEETKLNVTHTHTQDVTQGNDVVTGGVLHVRTTALPDPMRFNATEAAQGYCHTFHVSGQKNYDLIREAIETALSGDPQVTANAMIAAREKYEKLKGKSFEYNAVAFVTSGTWARPEAWKANNGKKSVTDAIRESEREALGEQ